MTEKTLRREDKFKGKILDVHVDEVLLPDGTTSIREVVDHVDGVAVLALDPGKLDACTGSFYRGGK